MVRKPTEQLIQENHPQLNACMKWLVLSGQFLSSAEALGLGGYNWDHEEEQTHPPVTEKTTSYPFFTKRKHVRC